MLPSASHTLPMEKVLVRTSSNKPPQEWSAGHGTAFWEMLVYLELMRLLPRRSGNPFKLWKLSTTPFIDGHSCSAGCPPNMEYDILYTNSWRLNRTSRGNFILKFKYSLHSKPAPMPILPWARLVKWLTQRFPGTAVKKLILESLQQPLTPAGC